MMTGMKFTALASVSLLLCACGSGDPASELDQQPGETDQQPGDAGQQPGETGQRLESSNLSPVLGAEDDFDADVIPALIAAARAIPFGTTQSTPVQGDRTPDEMTARVGRDEDGNVVYNVTGEGTFWTPVPGPPRQGLALALFTDLIPGIEPDLTSYPHEVLGLWATENQVGAFWDRSPGLETVGFDSTSPAGTATYTGDAVGLHAADGSVAKFLADAELVADFSADTIGGTVDAFRSFSGAALGDLSVTLEETAFLRTDGAFSGSTGAGVAGSGHWGARWADDKGWNVGGTFGFAADDGSVAVLGAFQACGNCTSAANGNPDDAVATGN